MNNLKPLFDKVLIARDTLKATGIIIPESTSDRNAPAKGTVIAVGPDTEQISVDDRVIFGQNAGSYIKDDADERIFICLDTDVLCIIGDK